MWWTDSNHYGMNMHKGRGMSLYLDQKSSEGLHNLRTNITLSVAEEGKDNWTEETVLPEIHKEL